MPAPPQAEAYAVVAFREQGRWQVGSLPDAVTDDLDALVAAVRQQPGENGAIALVDVADEFFVAVRVRQGRVRLLLSDVTASAEWDLATQVSERETVRFRVGFVRLGRSVAQLTFTPAPGADLTPTGFDALLVRAGDRLRQLP